MPLVSSQPALPKTDEPVGQHVVTKPTDLPASVFRHTYLQNSSFVTGNLLRHDRASFPRLNGNKSTRIRLRPRQTLCSNCKSTCLDSKEGPVPLSNTVTSLQHSKQHEKQRTHLPQSSSSMLSGSNQKHVRKRSKDGEISHRSSKQLKIYNNPVRISKTSPFIKISIGDNNVMNIPPRLHDIRAKESSPDTDSVSHVDDGLDDNSEEVDDEVIFNFKPSLMRQRLEETNNSRNKKNGANSRKSKKSKHKNKESQKGFAMSPKGDGAESERPRLVYTIHQSKGSKDKASLSPHRLDANGDSEDTQSSEDRQYSFQTGEMDSKSFISKHIKSVFNAETKSVSDRSEIGSINDSGSDIDSVDYGDGPPGDSLHSDEFKPLMMKIHTNSVDKCCTPDGREFHIEDIVWGKVKGFPWWPGRVMSISVSEKDNGVVIRQMAQVAWFNASTMSHIDCSDLYPFLDDFKLKFERKKKSKPYRRAVKQATIAAKSYQTGDLSELKELIAV